MLFAHLKCIHRLGRLRLCGPSGARRAPIGPHRPKSPEIGEAIPFSRRSSPHDLEAQFFISLKAVDGPTAAPKQMGFSTKSAAAAVYGQESPSGRAGNPRRTRPLPPGLSPLVSR
jgi:hypothetical protein